MMLRLTRTSRFRVFDLDPHYVHMNQQPNNAMITQKNKTKPEVSSPSMGCSVAPRILVDIDANLLHADLKDDILLLRTQAYNKGIRHLIVPGSNIVDSQESLLLSSQTNFENNKSLSSIYSTVGIHPYHVPVLTDFEDTMNKIETLIEQNIHLCKAVGETGLDTAPGFPPIEQQLPYFESHVKLAKKYQLPLFLHERGAFHEFCEILSRNGYDEQSHLGKTVIIHCFTGSRTELELYISKGYYIGITGYIFRKNDDSVNELIEALEQGIVPLDKLMIETDAPYMGFKGCRHGFKSPTRKYPNIPNSLNLILEELAKILKLDQNELARITTNNANQFFKLF